jgi:anti-sigma regulatory factor (Ser/Thr protein kinase)
MGQVVFSSAPAILRLTLSCELALVRQTAEAARKFLGEQQCAAGHLIDCELALVEACNNAVEHCNGGTQNLPILVEILCDAQQTELRVTDHTPGFEWPAQTALPDAGSESGRGLFLITAVMDYAGYFRGRGENILVMRKRSGGK